MDYKKLNSHIILHLLVAGAILVFAIFIRIIAIQANVDIGTANLIFIATIVILAIIYLIILSTLANSFIPWLLKKFPFRQQKQEESSETPIEQLVISVEQEISEQDYEAIRRNYQQDHLSEIAEKIKTFQKYTNLVLAPYTTDEELKQLHRAIEYYAKGEVFPNKKEFIPVKIKNVRNKDLFHFGWNMAHYFERPKQDIVPWLQIMFKNLEDLESSYIKGKLFDTTGKYIIPNIEDIPAYLAD